MMTTIMRRHLLLILLSSAIAFAIAVPSIACAADDCGAAIKSELNGLCGSLQGNLQAAVAVPGAEAPPPVKCPKPGITHVVVFERGESLKGRAPPSTHNNATLNPLYSYWGPVVATSCTNLYDAVYDAPTAGAVPAVGNAQPVPVPASKQGVPSATMKQLHDAINSTSTSGAGPTADQAHTALRRYRTIIATSGGSVPEAVPGTSTGLFADAAQETLQILGQIVADRATAQAYALLKQKLMDLLKCQPDSTSTAGFNATCKVLVPLRMQDIAASGDAFLSAIVSDGLGFIEAKIPFANAVDPIWASLVTNVVVPLVTKVQRSPDASSVRQIVDALVTYADKGLPEVSLTQQERVVVVGVTAYLQCITPETAADTAQLLAACDIGANVSKLAGSDVAIIPAASLLAQDLVFVATPTKGSARPRIERAVDMAFGTMCMMVSTPIPAPVEAPAPATPPQGTAPTTTGANPAGPALPIAATPQLACMIPTAPPIKTAQDALALAQPIIDDAISGDTNALVTAIVQALQYVNSTIEDHDKARAFALIGGLLEYTATYTQSSTSSPTSASMSGSGSGSTSGSGSSLHSQRTQILESLTAMMTDRTGREGDVVASLGGSLRLVGGARVGLQEKGAAFFGPLSLPLGVAVTQIPATTGCRCGVHVEIDAVDLGQYLSWNQGASVATPQIEDALSPSTTVGVAFGPTMPFVIGVTAGYSPSFVLNTADPSSKGTFNLGVVVGVDVPLIDLN
jgi:hypothetical protein